MGRKDPLTTMLTFETENPSQCGIVKVDKSGVVQAFYEKVRNPREIGRMELYTFLIKILLSF